ncbi:hypothetical protein HOY82DRAFT_612927 [Tuber indicum]|nr:hypothetical protein HOY82DRAFT_612927 [Tuber indicum]
MGHLINLHANHYNQHTSLIVYSSTATLHHGGVGNLFLFPMDPFFGFDFKKDCIPGTGSLPGYMHLILSQKHQNQQMQIYLNRFPNLNLYPWSMMVKSYLSQSNHDYQVIITEIDSERIWTSLNDFTIYGLQDLLFDKTVRICPGVPRTKTYFFLDLVTTIVAVTLKELVGPTNLDDKAWAKVECEIN